MAETLGHKHDFLDLEAFCNSHDVVVVVVAVAAADVDVDDAAVAAVAVDVAVVVVVAAAAAAAVGGVAAAVAVGGVAAAAAVDEACPVVDHRLEHSGPLVLRLEEIFFGRSLPYVDHEVAK